MYSARPRFSLLESEPVKPKKALKMLSGFLASHASEPAEEGLEAAPGKVSRALLHAFVHSPERRFAVWRSCRSTRRRG